MNVLWLIFLRVFLYLYLCIYIENFVGPRTTVSRSVRTTVQPLTTSRGGREHGPPPTIPAGKQTNVNI